MTKAITNSPLPVTPRVQEAWEDVGNCFERFCLTAGGEALQAMMEADAVALCGERHARSSRRAGYRWGTTQGKIGFHGGNVDVVRPRVRARGKGGKEMELPTWGQAVGQDWLGKWAMNLMLINVSTRKISRAVRLPEGHLPITDGDGTSKSAASRRFVALSSDRLAEFMASDLSKLDLLVIQIDGLHVTKELVLLAAIGIDGAGRKHPLGLVEGTSENRATAQALR
jgi:transposase-like protein